MLRTQNKADNQRDARDEGLNPPRREKQAHFNAF